MEPTTPGAGYWPSAEPSPTSAWWQASDGQWYPPAQWPPTTPATPPAPPATYQWPAPQPPQWGVAVWQPPTQTGNGFSITGIVLGAIAFLFLPPLLGVAGLIFGGIGLSKKERLAPVAMVVAGLGLVVGMILGALVFAAVHRGG